MTKATATKGSAVLTLPSDTQILITRRFDAPPEHVFRVLTEPDLIRRWWAGRRGTVTSVDVDLRTGGIWRYEMQTDDGLTIAFRGEYHEVVPNERIVFTEIYETGPGATNDGGVQCTYALTPDGDGTTLTMLTDARDQATRDLIVGSGMEGGVQEGLDIAEEVAVGLVGSTSR